MPVWSILEFREGSGTQWLSISICGLKLLLKSDDAQLEMLLWIFWRFCDCTIWHFQCLENPNFCFPEKLPHREVYGWALTDKSKQQPIPQRGVSTFPGLALHLLVSVLYLPFAIWYYWTSPPQNTPARATETRHHQGEVIRFKRLDQMYYGLSTNWKQISSCDALVGIVSPRPGRFISSGHFGSHIYCSK